MALALATAFRSKMAQAHSLPSSAASKVVPSAPEITNLPALALPLGPSRDEGITWQNGLEWRIADRELDRLQTSARIHRKRSLLSRQAQE
jgi:hypothetical protein